MTTKAVIWDKNPNQNGLYRILIYCYHNGIKKYYKTGISVKQENWSKAKQEVVGVPQMLKSAYNEKIGRMKADFQLKMANGVPANMLDKEDDLAENAKSFIAFLEKFIAQESSTIDGLTKGTLKAYTTTLNRLNGYCTKRQLSDLTFEDIDMAFYHDFANYIKNVAPGVHGFSNKVKIIKRVMKVAYQRGLHENKIFENPQFKRVRQKTVGKIYLTEAEIKLLEEVDLSTMPGYDRERDRFLISYYFLMRWSDSVALEKKYFFEDENSRLNLKYIAQKTGITCVLPVSSKAKEILLKRDYSFAKNTIKHANETIKEIAALAGISTVITQGRVVAPKFKFITSHTARRSAATNLYLSGMDLQTLAKLGGWSDLQTLRVYLRASGLEVAQNARNFDFFK